MRLADYMGLPRQSMIMQRYKIPLNLRNIHGKIAPTWGSGGHLIA